MSTVVVDIDTEVQKYIPVDDKNLNIYDLFDAFWIDLNFLLKEKKYNNSFIESLENWNYITSDTF